MVEEKPITAPTPTERNAFPLTRSIVVGVVSLLAVRYIFGLAPLAYPIDREHVDFYYRGLVVSVSPPMSYCYTGQVDLIENLSQVKRALLDEDEVFKFVTFRTFRECRLVYLDEGRVYGYHRLLSHRFYWRYEMEDASPGAIGFVGVGAELVPASPENAKVWLESKGLAAALRGRVWSSRILPYFPQSDSSGESLRVVVDQSFALGAGRCSMALGRFVELDYGFNDCEPGQEECESTFDEGLERYKRWSRGDYEGLDMEGRVKEKGFLRMAIFVTPFKGRAIYYGFAQETSLNPEGGSYAEFREWGQQVCRSAQETSAVGLTAQEAERGFIGYSR